MYEISRLAHDIAGGFIATLPHEWDLNNPETGKWIEKFFVGNEEYTARDRIKIARLLENMSGGTALAAVSYTHLERVFGSRTGL